MKALVLIAMLATLQVSNAQSSSGSPGSNYLNHQARAVKDIVVTPEYSTIFSNYSLYTQGLEERFQSINYVSEGWNSAITQYQTKFTMITLQYPSNRDAARLTCTRNIVIRDFLNGSPRTIQFSAPVCK